MLIDAHCHLNYPQLKNNLSKVIADAQENGVEHMITICTKQDDFPEILAIINEYKCVSGAFGIHPCDANNDKDIVSPEEIKKKCQQHSKIVTIGETGLDYYHGGFNKKNQRQSFVNHLQVAAELDLPVTIHARNADDDMIEILQAEMKNAPFRGLMHCFASSKKLARVALDLDLYISFSGIVTFNSASEIKEVAQFAPNDKILVETDAPFLTPSPYRHIKTNQPLFVKYVAEEMAKLRAISIMDLSLITKHNTLNLFNKINLNY